MPKIFNIILNSNNKIAGGTNGNATYHFDWSVLPVSKYKVTFSLVANKNTLTGTRTASVFVDLGQRTCFTTSATRTSAQTTRFLGFLFFFSGQYLVSPSNINPPIYLEDNPNNNSFSVQILDGTGAIWLDDATTPVQIGDYVLNLNLETVE